MGSIQPEELAEAALAQSNGNANRNTYLWQDRAWTLAEASRADRAQRNRGGSFGDGRGVLWGVPISIKDCFDLTGAPTTAGVEFYRWLNGIHTQDSWVVEQLRSAGAVITGKTHLHPLAYGITGENREFGDCMQPGKPDLLTGGSSSGAAASVLEGSAISAIGTDTGGSIRTPAALCGLAGYRATLGRGDWRGGAHLAQSFDTYGWLFRDLEDAPLLGSFYAPPNPIAQPAITRFAVIDKSFLHDCEPEVITSLEEVAEELERLGLARRHFSSGWWADSFQIFAPIQAWEAARIHAGHHDQFEPAIRERLEWGARITDEELAILRERHREFRTRLTGLFAEFDLLLMPATPVAQLRAGADHSQTRSRLLRYTTPFSLGGVPVVTVPCRAGGVQLAVERCRDEALLQLAARLGAARKQTHS